MKLINKLSALYFTVALAVILTGGVFAYYQIKHEIDRAEIVRLQNLNDKIAEQLRSGDEVEIQTNGRPVEIKQMGVLPLQTVHTVSESSLYNPDIKHKECRLNVSSQYNINGKPYQISSYNYITKANEIFKGLLNSFIAILVLLLLLVLIFGRFVSAKVLAPFNQTLEAIHKFRLKDKKRLNLSHSNTKEFSDLNNFLQRMTDKALADYSSLKEFSENASHELQTPLAVVMSKIDQLSQSEINDAQAQQLSEIQKNIDKLSRISQSLTLLAKLENNEYLSSESIYFCRAAKDSLSSFEELIEIKSLTLHKEISKNTELKFHPALADILLNNLLGNAIRHNVENGQIDFRLEPNRLIIRNTGNDPEVATEELFKRFKKGLKNENSIGIGLAIVKQIVEMNNFTIRYDYAEGWHTIEIHF